MRDERPVYLVGFMGSGKTTVGRLVALGLGWSFQDTDDLVARHENRTIERIFAESGEGRFRRLEWERLEAECGSPRVVVATGGGLFLGNLQRRWLREQGRTVWLDAPLSACRARVGTGGVRPLWRAEPLVQRAQFERRRVAYALAELRVESGVDTPAAEVARRVLVALEGDR